VRAVVAEPSARLHAGGIRANIGLAQAKRRQRVARRKTWKKLSLSDQG